MKELLTPKQVARAIGVSEASLKRWCDKGLVPALRTAGGHRRIPINGVVQFLRASGHPIVRPEVLGLPVVSSVGDRAVERARRAFEAALVDGDEMQARQSVFNLYLAGHSVVDICDEMIGPTFVSLGDRWQHGALEVYQERRGCEITLQVLRELRLLVPRPPEGAPYAIGGTLADDPYTIPNAMVEVVLREAGWRAESHGCGNPPETLAAAIVDRRPRLFWLTVSAIESVPRFLEDCRVIEQAADDRGVALVVGGRALSAEVRREMRFAAYGDNLRHLVAFARTLLEA